MPPDTIMPEFHISQRNRLGLTFLSRRLKIHASFQEIHLWGRESFSSVASVNASELFVEPAITRQFSVRIGRQGISLDNGRMFSDAPWAQQSRSHEGIRLMYNAKTITSDLIVAFTRSYSDEFEPAFSPVASHRYKFLFIHHGKYKINNTFTATSLNAVDVFEPPTRGAEKYFRATAGGRLEYMKNSFYWTVSASYQFGESDKGARLNAYYLQPELRYIFSDDLTLRLGAEILSGEESSSDPGRSRSFVPLYGVAWKFMGNMNLFTRFPLDVKDRGLINPYLFALYEINKSLVLRSDFHLFWTQHHLPKSDGVQAHRFLGFENDISLRWTPAKSVDISFGFSYVLASNSMDLLNKVRNHKDIPVWSYLMISYRPAMFNSNL